MRGYICCFCGEAIAKEDEAAVRLIATNLWERDAAQSVYAHSQCAADQMAAGQLSPDALQNDQTGYSAQEIIRGEDESRNVRSWTCLAVVAAIVAVAYLLFSVVDVLSG